MSDTYDISELRRLRDAVADAMPCQHVPKANECPRCVAFQAYANALSSELEPMAADITDFYERALPEIVTLTKRAERAEAAARVYREALEACRAQWREPGEGTTAYFERQAERFYRETGLMAPGKSQPLEMPDNEEERSAAWEEFFNRPYRLMEAALGAAPAAGEETR